MANKIIISGTSSKDTSSLTKFGGKITNLGTDVYEFPLLDDLIIDATSEFSSFSEDLGEISDLINIGVKIDATRGAVGQGSLFVQNIMDAKRWRKTNPIKFAVRIPLFTKTNPKKDVFDIFLYLLGYSILYKKGTDYLIPGINLANVSNYNKTDENRKQKLIDKGRFLTVKIPGVFNLSHVLIDNIRPTISKDKTESGYPLWMLLDISFESIYPASTADFENSGV